MHIHCNRICAHNNHIIEYYGFQDLDLFKIYITYTNKPIFVVHGFILNT